MTCLQGGSAPKDIMMIMMSLNQSSSFCPEQDTQTSLPCILNSTHTHSTNVRHVKQTGHISKLSL